MAKTDREKARAMAARGATVQEIKNATDLKPAAVKTVVNNWAPAAIAVKQPSVQEVRQATGVSRESAQNIVARATAANTSASSSSSSAGTNTNNDGGFTSGGGSPSGGASAQDLFDLINEAEYNAGIRGAELASYERTQSYSADVNKAIAQLQQAAQTERLKYEVDNKIPLAQAEAKGKIDLQKIVNRGYENVSRIQRGSDMFRSIAGMFNF